MKLHAILYDNSTIELDPPTEDETSDISNSDGDSSDTESLPPMDDTSDGDIGDNDSSDSDISEATGDTSETVENRPLLTTPLDTYTVTEGLLLIAVVILAGSVLLSIFRGR